MTRTLRLLSRVIRAVIKNPNAPWDLFVKHPETDTESFSLLPSVVQGENFSRKSPFSTAPQPDGSGLEPANPLLTYFNAHKEGAGIWKWLHYFDSYHRHFSKFIGREVHVLEVGIYAGGSLSMWKEYFGKKCRVYGVDIEDACKVYKDDRTEVFIGDQADRSFWAKVRQAVPNIDILIDDGGHLPVQQQITLEEMLPHLRPGGVYLCEDIHGANNQFTAYLQGLARSLFTWVPCETPAGISGIASTPSNFQQAIRAIHLYPFVAVIERREEILRQLIAPKHGTQWQPFR